MRAEFRRVELEDQEDVRQLERVWHNARVLVGAASIRLLGRQKLEQQQVTTWLSWVGERLATTLSLSLLKEQLIEALPRLQILRGSIALYTGPRSHQLEVLVAVKDGVSVAKSGGAFPEVELAPDEILADDRCLHFVVMPISFETQLLGVALLESGGLPSVYEGLRQQIASAVKGAMMHHEIIAQVTLRERLEAERMAEEARVAASIQTSMAPVQMQVHGLEIAGLMAPAAESGGDYYDVLPTRDGAWLAIGDVTGHGLGAGLIMLMLQSMISSLSRVEPALTPSELLCTVGDAIWDNVRQRLRRDDHATLTVLHYFGHGRFVFAGAHEEMIVWRKRTGLCETIPTPGFWVGALPSIRRMTQDSELLLEAGDLLVLYTDGVTEARNAHHEQFSLERLVRLVEERGKSPVNVLRDAIRDVVLSWSASVDDDMTLLLIRYVGDA
jgi:serine phosphatase RsbU (regulator of sigma subunit)